MFIYFDLVLTITGFEGEKADPGVRGGGGGVVSFKIRRFVQIFVYPMRRGVFNPPPLTHTR